MLRWLQMIVSFLLLSVTMGFIILNGGRITNIENRITQLEFDVSKTNIPQDDLLDWEYIFLKKAIISHYHEGLKRKVIIND